jgi:hypothetical protein
MFQLLEENNPTRRQANERPSRRTQSVFIPALQLQAARVCNVVKGDREAANRVTQAAGKSMSQHLHENSVL